MAWLPQGQAGNPLYPTSTSPKCFPIALCVAFSRMLCRVDLGIPVNCAIPLIKVESSLRDTTASRLRGVTIFPTQSLTHCGPAQTWALLTSLEISSRHDDFCCFERMLSQPRSLPHPTSAIKNGHVTRFTGYHARFHNREISHLPACDLRPIRYTLSLIFPANSGSRHVSPTLAVLVGTSPATLSRW